MMFHFVMGIALHLFFLHKAKVDGFKSPAFEVVTLVTGNAGDVIKLHR